MDVALVLKGRLKELDLEQRQLANAAQVTESYISQLLNGKKAPPAPGRTDIYQKMETFLKMPVGELSRLVDVQLLEAMRSKLRGPSSPLFKEARELVLRKCACDKQEHMRATFEKEPFGELERLVTQKLLDVVKVAVKQELDSEDWVREVARLSGQSYEEIRVTILEFLDADIFHVSSQNCVSFLEPLIESWDIDLGSFSIEVILNNRVASEPVKRLEFVETKFGQPAGEEPGLRTFLEDARLSADATGEEIEFLGALRFKSKRPTPLYYYRELQNLRDPLHFDG